MKSVLSALLLCLLAPSVVLGQHVRVNGASVGGSGSGVQSVETADTTLTKTGTDADPIFAVNLSRANIWTADIGVTKADPHLLFVPATATDTRWTVGACDDAGADDDDIFQISSGSTPCATGVRRMEILQAGIQGAPLGEFRFYPIDSNDGHYFRIANRSNEIIETGAIGGNSVRWDLINGSNGDNCIVFKLQSADRWKFDCNNDFELNPATDNVYSVGSPSLRPKSVWAGTSVNAGLTGNATLRAETPVGVGNVGSNSCGTTAATITGTNTAGKVTVGATAGTQCRITFSSAWTNAPACIVSNETTANLARATSTTTTVDLTGVFVAGDTLAYQCLGY